MKTTEIEVAGRVAADLLERANKISGGKNAEHLQARAICTLLDALLREIGHLREELRG